MDLPCQTCIPLRELQNTHTHITFWKLVTVYVIGCMIVGPEHYYPSLLHGFSNVRLVPEYNHNNTSGG